VEGNPLSFYVAERNRYLADGYRCFDEPGEAERHPLYGLKAAAVEMGMTLLRTTYRVSVFIGLCFSSGAGA
jgi:hypothetical protein